VAHFGAVWGVQGPGARRTLGDLLGKGIAECFAASDSPLEGVVITVCSRCKRTISQTPGEGSEKKVSHGICAGCLVILENEIRESSKVSENGPKPETVPLHAEDP
jgi:hypothetical protein